MKTQLVFETQFDLNSLNELGNGIPSHLLQKEIFNLISFASIKILNNTYLTSRQFMLKINKDNPLYHVIKDDINKNNMHGLVYTIDEFKSEKDIISIEVATKKSPVIHGHTVVFESVDVNFQALIKII